MSGTILVTGATGRLGRLIVERLVEQGRAVRVFTRHADAARTLFGQGLEIASGDFADRTSLNKALAGIDRLLLLSPISERLADEQISAADAAAAAGVQRIVKISGSDWTIDPAGNSISGDAHASIERHLTGLMLDSVSLRPNAWMQVSLANTIRLAIAGQTLRSINPDAGVGYIDARDIADVAVHQLLADRIEPRPLVLTGPHVVSLHEIAQALSRHLGRQVGVEVGAPPPTPSNDPDFEHRAVAQFQALIAAGRAASITPTVETLLGRPPRTVETFIAGDLGKQSANAVETIAAE